MLIEAFAPAKVNLALHVTGRRPDGYHLLDSLVVFADLGDRLRLAPGPLSLTVTGPRAAGVPQDGTNLVMKAAALIGVEARIALEKTLPTAAGVGGGSSDAAAALRGLAALSGRAIPEALCLGADLPVCLAAPAPARAEGIGERLSAVPDLPPLWILLVNPGVGVATPAVYGALTRRDHPPMSAPPGAARFLDWLCRQRNDLAPHARAFQPVIGEVLAAIAGQKGCRLARMSGSGATCFGLFAAPAAAEAARAAIARAAPRWWVAAAPVLTAGAPLVASQLTRATT